MWQNRLDQSDQPVQPTFFGGCTLGDFNPPTGFDPAPHNPLRKQGGGGGWVGLPVTYFVAIFS